MALTDRQKATVTQNLQSRIKGPCPMCGQQQWTIGDEIVAATTTSLGGGMAIGGPMVPMIQVICNTCGFVAHHAVGALGIQLND